ncbi:MAG: alpha/beta hydrolase [Ginsengibacter sp.]
MRLLLLFTCCFIIKHTKGQTDSLSSKFPTDSNYFSSFDGTKIYYEVRGEGKPVLLVHGFIVNSNSWKRSKLYADLLNGGYKVIILDMRGNGKSGKPHDTAAYENDAEAKDIMKLMDLLKIKQYSAVGYSRGSIITARLLVLDERVGLAVLGGMGTDFTNPEWPRRKMFYRAMMGDSIPELKGAVDYVKQQGLDQLALAYLQKAQPSTSKEALVKIKQPVLVICGDKDSDNGSAAELAKLLPNAYFETVPGDHNHASATSEFSNAVKLFLEKDHLY